MISVTFGLFFVRHRLYYKEKIDQELETKQLWTVAKFDLIVPTQEIKSILMISNDFSIFVVLYSQCYRQ